MLMPLKSSSALRFLLTFRPTLSTTDSRKQITRSSKTPPPSQGPARRKHHHVPSNSYQNPQESALTLCSSTATVTSAVTWEQLFLRNRPKSNYLSSAVSFGQSPSHHYASLNGLFCFSFFLSPPAFSSYSWHGLVFLFNNSKIVPVLPFESIPKFSY